MVVATVKTFQPWPDVQSYATKMFENGGRGIGDKGKDNGLLVLLAVDDRQVWVEVGYDLEGVVTDGFAGETSRQRDDARTSARASTAAGCWPAPRGSSNASPPTAT